MNKNKEIKKIVVALLFLLSYCSLAANAIFDDDELWRMHQDLQLKRIQNQLDGIQENSPEAIAEEEGRRRTQYWVIRLEAILKAYKVEEKRWDKAYKTEKKKWDKIYKKEKKSGATQTRLNEIASQSKSALEQISAMKVAKLNQLRVDLEKVRKDSVFSLYGIRE